MNLDEKQRWKYSYEGDFHPKVIEIKEIIKNYNELIKPENFDESCQNKFFIACQKLIQGAIKTLKFYFRYQGIFQVKEKEIIKEAFYVEIIQNGQAWIDMLYDVLEEKQVDYRTFCSIYLPEIEKLDEYFKDELKGVQKKRRKFLKNTTNEKNKFGLDKYTTNQLIEYFKYRNEIKIVKVFGSRVRGTNRFASDVDMFIEGTYTATMVDIFKDEVNRLKIPYRIDFHPLFKEVGERFYFISTNYEESDYFYNAKDFYPEDSYVEQGWENVISADNQIWKRRYKEVFDIGLMNFLDILEDVNMNLKNDINDYALQIKLFENFKYVFEKIWKVLKCFYKEQGILMFLPKEIFEKACKEGILSDFSVWNDLIFDFNIMTDEKFVNINDEMIYRLKTKYLPAIEEFKNYFAPKI